MGLEEGPLWARSKKIQNFWGTLWHLIRYMGTYRMMLYAGLIMTAAATVMALIGPQFLSQITDSIQNSVQSGSPIDIEGIATLCVITASLYLLSMILSTLEHYIIGASSEYIARKMRGDLSDKLNSIHISYFDNSTSGDIMSRVSNDADTVGRSCSESMTRMITAIISIVGAFFMMLYTNIELAMVSAVPALIGFVVIYMLIKVSQKYFRIQQEKLGSMNSIVDENYRGHEIVRLYGGETGAWERFNKVNDNLYVSSLRSRFIAGLMMQFMNLISNIGYLTVCIFGSIMVLDGKIGYGTIVAFIVYVKLFTQPLIQLSESLGSVQMVVAASERVFEFLALPEMEDDSGKTVTLDKVEGKVEFRDVHFSYVKGKEIIHGLSMEIPAGSRIAIVGPTGSGKTTIANLLMKFYEPDSGTILIDGKETSSMRRNYVHSLFDVVLQDSWLFNGTVRENIVFNRVGVDDEKVMWACDSVGLRQFVESLPEGLDTIITDKLALSGGQKQQMMIARMLIRDAPMVILDEATATIDTLTERNIQHAMEILTEGKTSFVIAHRLSTIMDSDLIIVIKDGTIIEQGTHDQLLGNRGFYHSLYNSQFENCA
ncbi:MAG: ABC transporter ATP-binding protein [Candidatus Methanomethylophilaceae archaeon]|nr:ABC transporter ATP-binding protein [Candidatus Methanomethylophilaceae archaeon]